MAFISVSEEIIKKSFTGVENKFITKYLPVLEPVAVKVYLFALYLFQNGMSSYSITDLAAQLSITEDEAINYFNYLEEFELVSITSRSPFEVKILEAENVYGTPKKYKPEKYGDFTKSVQNILKGRMISTNEFRDYFYLLEEYSFEQDALLMIITYCVNLKGDNIRVQYIKKVAKSFAEEGATTAKKVDEKLSAYTSSTPALLKIFSAVGISRQPDIDDEKLYKKWLNELGFEDAAIICAAKHYKAKTCEKIDDALTELYKNRKFDVKEIEDFCKNKTSVYNLTIEIARYLGVYMQNSAPYIENYVNVWYNYGYSFSSLKTISKYCFKQSLNSFEDMNFFISKLYDEGIVADKAVDEYIEKLIAEDKLIKDLLSACGLTRKIIKTDRENLLRWKSWNFSDEMLFAAAKTASGKNNPIAYMNAVLSGWKQEGIFNTDKITTQSSQNTRAPSSSSRSQRAEIERHFYDLRHSAEERADNALKTATSDEIYGEIYKELNSLAIKLAFAEIKDKSQAEMISKRIKVVEEKGDKRLKELKIDKSDFVPKYSCTQCNDTGYLSDGTACDCLKKFVENLKA